MRRAKVGLTISIVVLTSLIVTSILLIRSDWLHLRVFPATAASETVSVRHTDQVATMNGKKRLLYVQPQTAAAASMQQSTKIALSMAKVAYQVITAGEIMAQAPKDAVLLIADEELAAYENAVIDFIEAGGNAVFMHPLSDPSAHLQQLLGVTTWGQTKRVFGLHFTQTLYPGYPNVQASDSEAFSHEAAALSLTPDATSLITAENQPLLIENQTLGGKVQYWNTHYLGDKLARGLFVQSVSRLFDVFVTAQAGIQVMHIDDFPAPVPENTTTIADGTGAVHTVADFYAHYWWPDMLRLARQYDLKYTGALIGTYGNDTSGATTDLYTLMRKTGQKYTRALMQLDGELSLHGFNHQPLLTADDPVDPALKYRPWPSLAAMEAGLVQVATLANTLATTEAITTYVPPSNLLSATGLTAVTNVFKEIDTVAALYFGENTDSRYVTEYGQDELDATLFDFPRNVSGYANTPNNRYEIADVAATFGVVSHFVHPDDVFDQARANGADWPTLAKGYAGQLAFIQKNYPQLTPMTQSMATKTLKQYFAGAIDVNHRGQQIEILSRHMPTAASVNVRLDQGHLKTGNFKDHQVTKLADRLYHITLKAAAVTVTINS